MNKEKIAALIKKNKTLLAIVKGMLELRLAIVRAFHSRAKFLKYYQEFLELPECRDGEMSLEFQYRKGNLAKIDKPIKEYYRQLWKIIDDQVRSRGAYTIVRMGDGELNFIRGIIKGNIPRRHYTEGKAPSEQYLSLFREGLLKCDLIHIEMYRDIRRSLNRFYKKKIYSEIPLECVYGLIASREIFKREYKIGIIGADNKIDIIKKLLCYPEYAEYIGRSSFDDYIEVPERGTSNNVLELAQSIKSRLKSEIDIYLVGIGQAKLAIMPEIVKGSRAVFIDVGCGISALAGLVSNTRPYFADWINYRLPGYNYDSIDTMDASFNSGIIKNL